jgi:hypothetical protein
MAARRPVVHPPGLVRPGGGPAAAPGQPRFRAPERIDRATVISVVTPLPRAHSGSLRMLLGCTIGMLIGLAIDAATTPIDAIAELCRSSDGFIASTLLHWRLLPAMHLLMLVGALAPGIGLHEGTTGGTTGERWRRRGLQLGCAAAMLLGMALAMPLAPALGALLGSAFAGMLGAMMLGMAAASALWHPLQRRHARAAPPQRHA